MRLQEHIQLDEALSLKKAQNSGYFGMLGEEQQNFFNDFWPLVLRDCKPFLKELTKGGNTNLLYRGSNTLRDLAGWKATRKDRRPMSTHHASQDIIDEIQYDLYGWKPRSSGIFASGNANVASQYGQRYVIFPAGKLQFIYGQAKDSFDFWKSDKVAAAVLKFEEDIMKVYNIETKGSSELDKESEDILSGFGASNVRFANWKQNFAWDIESYLDIPEAREIYKKAFEDILINQMKYTDENFLRGLQAGYEMIIKCDRYYFFLERDFETFLRVAVFNK